MTQKNINYGQAADRWLDQPEDDPEHLTQPDDIENPKDHRRELAKGQEIQNGWRKEFFEEVVGGWKGEPLKRPDQGAFENRKTF